jgi:hypothetical protein
MLFDVRSGISYIVKGAYTYREGENHGGDTGFPVGFMSGFCTSAARLGQPDTGLISYGEMVDQGRCITFSLYIDAACHARNDCK